VPLASERSPTLARKPKREGEWKVADANTLRRSGLLPDFLARDRRNMVVITDFCCMECYQGDSVRTLASSLAIIARSPERVLILKSAGELALLSACDSKREDFVDWDQTYGFADFCEQAARAAKGDEHFVAAVGVQAAAAKDYLSKVSAEAADIGAAMRQVAAELPPHLTKRLRRKLPLTQNDILVVIDGISALACELFTRHPEMLPPGATSLPSSSLVFRFALACYLLTIAWAAMGGIETAPPSKLKNDIIDMNYVAVGTLFSGALSNDKKVNEIYESSMLFLNNVFCDAV
jgi:hypothetical protein